MEVAFTAGNCQKSQARMRLRPPTRLATLVLGVPVARVVRDALLEGRKGDGTAFVNHEPAEMGFAAMAKSATKEPFSSCTTRSPVGHLDPEASPASGRPLVATGHPCAPW